MDDPDANPADREELCASIDLSPIAMVITDPGAPDNPIIAANEAFTRLTGYQRDEIVGRNCRFLAGRDTNPSAQALLRDAIASARAVLAEMTNYRKDGTPFRNAVMIAPVLDDAGKARLYVGSQMEVSGTLDALSDTARERITGLSRRQREVLEHLVRGLRNKQIAAELGIDEKTVKMHRAAMLARLGCPTSADAIRVGVEAGLGR